MKHRALGIGVALGLLSSVVAAAVASAHPTEFASPLTAPPNAAFSTGGDYASDVLGDPWDFSNDEDVPAIPLVGSEHGFGIARDAANGLLNVDSSNGTTVKFVHTWGQELAWGGDGLRKPIDAAIYSQFTVRLFLPQARDIGLRYVTESGQAGLQFQLAVPAGWQTLNFDLTKSTQFGPSVWSGKVTRFELAVGGTADRFLLQIDWASLHRPDVRVTSAPGLAPQPVVKMMSPNEEGGADYATLSGNPWDFTGPDDVA